MIHLVKTAARAFWSLLFHPKRPNSDPRPPPLFRDAPPENILTTKVKNLQLRFKEIEIFDPNKIGRLYIGSAMFVVSAALLAHLKVKAARYSSKKRVPVAAATTFTCEICTDQKPFYSFRILTCDHYYCSECIGKYISSKLTDDNICAINCPALGCVGPFDPPQFRSILPEKVFIRWCDALKEVLNDGEEKFYCLFKDCLAMFIYDTNSGCCSKIECPNCRRFLCMKCNVQWHVGFTCEEFQKLKVGERSSEDLMLMNLAKQKNWKRCPNCKFFVERSEGCLFMRCRCGSNFCYNCGAPNMVDHYCHNCKH